MKMTALDKVAHLLVTIGGLNWGLIAFFDYNLVSELFGADTTITTVIYGAVGVAAVWMTYAMVNMMAGNDK